VLSWCVDVLMCWCVDVLMCWCVDVLMCWCVDVLMCWCVDVLCVDVLMIVLISEFYAPPPTPTPQSWCVGWVVGVGWQLFSAFFLFTCDCATCRNECPFRLHHKNSLVQLTTEKSCNVYLEVSRRIIFATFLKMCLFRCWFRSIDAK